MAKQPLLSERWFSGRVFVALNAALHGSPQEVREKERAFMSALVLSLLDRQREGTLVEADLWGFYAFCQHHARRSRAQILQDLWVLHMCKGRRRGFFVEFGACDGLMLSNTALLEQDFEWTGILAEPDPIWHEGLHANRACRIDTRCVAPEGGGRARFTRVPEMPELSRLSGFTPDDVHERNGNRDGRDEIEVDTVSLNALLAEHDAPGEIDYLSVDTEGSELAILESFDFSAHRIRLITVEHAGEEAKREGLRRLLTSHGYRRWRPEITRWDDWYILSE